jgi:lysophospholipase L1-like esterase
VLILAELSYQFIEKVFKRYYGVDNIFNFDSVRIYTAFVMMMTVMATSGVLTPQASGPKPTTKLEQRLKQNKKLLAVQNAKALSAQQAGKKATSQTEETSSQSASTAKGAISIAGGATSAVARKYNLTDAQYQTVKSKTVTAIGDSVLLDAGPSLQELMPSTVVDGQVGRQPNEAVTLVQQMAAKGTLAQNLLMVVGTNGAISPAQVQTVMAAAGSQRQVYWVGVAADRAWISGNNSVLLAAQKKYANLHLIDWPDAAKAHPEWLGPDQVHPNVQGSIQYTSLIAQKIAEN